MKQSYGHCTPALLLMTIAFLALGGCGVKPGHLQPPAGAENNGFPHTYPAPDTQQTYPAPVRQTITSDKEKRRYDFRP